MLDAHHVSRQTRPKGSLLGRSLGLGLLAVVLVGAFQLSGSWPLPLGLAVVVGLVWTWARRPSAQLRRFVAEGGIDKRWIGTPSWPTSSTAAALLFLDAAATQLHRRLQGGGGLVLLGLRASGASILDGRASAATRRAGRRTTTLPSHLNLVAVEPPPRVSRVRKMTTVGE